MKAADSAILLEEGYMLARIFNLINTDQHSAAFVYKGVRFWREHDQFMIQGGERTIAAGDVLDYHEFRKAILMMQRAIKAAS